MTARMLEQISANELEYSRALEDAAEVISKTDTRLLLVAGPSCAGKTTSSDRLSKHLKSYGRSTKIISLDDFYLSLDKTPKTPNGEYDFETIYALDLELIGECFENLCSGKVVSIPLFDFKTHARVENAQQLQLKEDEICIVEGLHALNPLIYTNYVDDNYVYKIFLDSFGSDSEREKTRLFRRLARDYYYRNADAQRTLEMWNNVVSSERNNIRPYQHLANVSVNTFFDYEPGVLKMPVLKVLKTLPSDSQFLDLASNIREIFLDVEAINFDLVPEESLLQEFIPPKEKRHEVLDL